MTSIGTSPLNWPEFWRQIAIFGSVTIYSAVGAHLVGLPAGVTSLLIGFSLVAAFSVLFNKAPRFGSRISAGGAIEPATVRRRAERSIVVLGATGDLKSRYLLPALPQVLPDVESGVRLIGVALDSLDTAGFAEHVRSSLMQHAADTSDEVREHRSPPPWTTCDGDVTDPATLQAALRMIGGEGPAVQYLALPHVPFEGVVAALGACELPPELRLLVEKPFGEDLAGAQRLNAKFGV